MNAAKPILFPVILGLVILYFCYHALTGKQGLANWTKLQSEETRLLADLEDIQLLRDEKQQHIARLRNETLDLDYLEEVARTKLSYSRTDEFLVAVK